MHAELVERRRWIGDERFLHALNFCILLPGPEAQQLATYAGWLLHIGGRVLKNSAMWALAALAFAGLFFAKLPFPFIVLGAGAIGFLGGNVRPDLFAVLKNHGAAAVVAIGLALRWTPVLAAGAWHGWHGTLFREGLFFSKAAMVTFGGAYAELPYVERLRENIRLTAALSAITAAVVGVILNLAVWFGWRVFQLARGGVDEMAVILAIAAFIGLVRWKWNVVWVVVGGPVAGWVLDVLAAA